MQDLNVKKPQGQTNTILSCYKGHCFGNLIRIFFFFFNEGKDLTLLYSAFLTAKDWSYLILSLFKKSFYLIRPYQTSWLITLIVNVNTILTELSSTQIKMSDGSFVFSPESPSRPKCCSFHGGAHPGRSWGGGAWPGLPDQSQRTLHQIQCKCIHHPQTELLSGLFVIKTRYRVYLASFPQINH